MRALVVVLLALSLRGRAFSFAADSECSVDSLNEGIRSGVIVPSDPAANHAITFERKNLNHEFGIYPAFYFMTGSSSENACAFYDKDHPDGVVAFGEALLRAEVQANGGPEYASSVPALMAHEYAHLLQSHNKVVSGSIAYELQADYLAGWYMGRRAKSVPGTSSQLLFDNMLRSFYAKGDYAFSHGTPAQRTSAVSAGYQHADLRLPDAFGQSLSFVPDPHLSPPTDYDPFELAASIREILEQQSSGFSSLRGPLDIDSKATWVATKKLPSAVSCTVHWTNTYQGEYECVMQESLEEANLEDKWKHLVDDIGAHFAKGWKRESRPPNSGSPDFSTPGTWYQYVAFISPQSDSTSVKIRIAKRDSHTGYVIEVDLPFDNY